MSVTEKQLVANRENAQKSTGPKTPEGKAVVSQNSVVHGLNTVSIVINSPHLKEDQADYDRLLASLTDDLKPVGLFQEHLVRKIANCIWRHRRVALAETAQISRQLSSVDRELDMNARYLRIIGRGEDSDNPETPEEKVQTLIDTIGAGTVPDDRHCKNLLRYEMRLDRQMMRAYSLLTHLQKRQPGKEESKEP